MAEKASTTANTSLSTKTSEDYMAIASLVVGIISICSSWFWCCGLPFGVIGIILGFLGKKSKSNEKLALAGIILSAIALVLAICFAVWQLMNGGFNYDFDYNL